MSELTIEIGKRIRNFRKSRNMTLDELSQKICKGKSTLYKYEKGEIAIDIETLYDLADALQVPIDQLLYTSASKETSAEQEIHPAFFQGLSTFYGYYYDGRVQKINQSVFEVGSQISTNQYKLTMYMNCKNLDQYQNAENVYRGQLEHFDTITHMQFTHANTPTEKAGIQVLASFLDADTKWGLWTGLSSRPLLPVSVKMLLSKKPLKMDASLTDQLKVSKEDIRHLKYYNFFTTM